MNYVGASGHGPVLIQCGSFDTINVEGCGELYRAASGPKEMRWYDIDHSFNDLEARLDRMAWLERELKLRPVLPVVERMWKAPRRQAAPLDVK